MRPRNYQPKSILFTLLLLLALPASLRAELTYQNNGTDITITGSNPVATGNLVIPATIEGLPVTAIGNSAFANMVGLTNVTMGSSIKTIDAFAFAGCDGLTSFNIPSSVTSIESSAFISCEGLTSMTFPNTVTSIGTAAFFHCTGVTAFMVGSDHPIYSSVDGVLFNKAQTELICFPSGKTGVYTIHSGVTNIGSHAFGGCDGLISVTLPNSVTTIDWWAFKGCQALRRIYFMGDAPAVDSRLESLVDTYATIYYLPGKTGWGTTFSGQPTATFNPAPFLQTIHDTARDQLVFSVKEDGDTAYTVEYTDGFKQWIPLTNKLTGTQALSQLDPESPNRPFRFYRISQQ